MIRKRAGVSQGVFAHYLNVRPKLVSEWERGEKQPSGPSLKLLSIVRTKGLDAITSGWGVPLTPRSANKDEHMAEHTYEPRRIHPIIRHYTDPRKRREFSVVPAEPGYVTTSGLPRA